MKREVLALFQRLFIFLLFSYVAFLSAAYALPFNILPKDGTQLPTFVNFTVTPSVPAFYTVYNNTVAPRATNFVKYLPPNVRQITVGGVYPDTCGRTFNFTGKGQAGSSCTLQLEVFGPVNPTDPNPRNHLLVCFPRGTTCAGTLYELNVTAISLQSISILPAAASATSGQTVQYTATGIYTNGSTQDLTTLVAWRSSNTTVATIDATGLATAGTPGTTAITAEKQGVFSNASVLTVVNPLVSIAITPSNASIHVENTQQFTATGTYASGSTADITNAVTWQSSNTAIGTIASTGVATGVSAGSTSITATQGGIVSEPAAMLNVDNPLVSIAITPTSGFVSPRSRLQFTAIGTFTDGSLQDITKSVTWNSSNTAAATITTGGTFAGLAHGVAVGTSNITATMSGKTSNVVSLQVQSFVYVVNDGTNISYCNLNGTTGALTGCLNSALVGNPEQITINPIGTFAYVTQNSLSNTISLCAISVMDGSLSNCTVTGDLTLVAPGQIAINPANTFAYVTNASGVVKCNINASTGALTGCSLTGDTTFPNPFGVAVNPAGTFAYITDGSNNNVTYCAINTNGALFNCTAATGTFTVPTEIAIDPSGGFAYIVSSNSTTVNSCIINPNGSFGMCTPYNSTFLGPRGIAQTASGSFAYVTNFLNNTVSVCSVVSGALVGCAVSPNMFSSPFGVSVN